MKQFVSADREQGMLMPYDVRMWLPEAHLARFVVDIVEGLDFKRIRVVKYTIGKLKIL